MNKDEFLTMFNDELEKLNNNAYVLKQRVDYFEKINPNGKDFKLAKYQLDLVQSKIYTLKKFIELPLYYRIQAMSDIEIEEYKNEKIKELELKIKEIEARKEQAKEKLNQLKVDQEQLIQQLGRLSNVEDQKVIIAKGMVIQRELEQYDINNQHGVFASIEKEIEKIQNEQNKIKNTSSEEIKKQISKELNSPDEEMAQELSYNRYLLPDEEMKASVASNPEAAYQMAELLTQRNQLIEKENSVKGEFYLSYEIPNVLRKKLKDSNGSSDSATIEFVDPDSILVMVNEFEQLFKQAKISFNEQFKEEKISKLIGKEFGVNSLDVDMQFLQQHSDKLGNGKLEHLLTIIAQRDQLISKRFKTNRVKREIENLNNQIKQEQSVIYKEIIGWYKIQNGDVLGLSTGISFRDIVSFENCLAKMRINIDEAQQAITRLKENLQNQKQEMKQQKEKYKNEQKVVEQQIRALAGPKFAKVDSIFSVSKLDSNLDLIKESAEKVHREDVINRTQQEAQNQADLKEAELRGITVEKLLEMRKQALNQQPQSSTGESTTSIKI